MNRTVLVTGASGGIGAAVARAFAQAGDAVVLGCNSNVAAANALCDEIMAEGGRALVAQGNLAGSAGVNAVFENAEAAFGPVQVLVACNGLALQKLATDVTDEEWQDVMDTSASATFYCCRRALPAMVRQKSGVILTVSSVWGQVGASCEVAYSAAKAAVIGLTKALAKEVGPSGIRVNCLAPGVVDAGMMTAFSQEDKDALCQEIPLGRLGTAGEIAKTALFLASEDAAYITGQVVAVGGGFAV